MLFPVILVGSLLAGLALQVDWTDIKSVLIWLTGVGAPYVVGYLVSLLAENWPAWHAFPRAVKFLVPMIVSILISLGATYLLSRADLLIAIGPYFALVVGAILAYLGTQNGYMATKRSGYGYAAKIREKKLEEDIEKVVKENNK